MDPRYLSLQADPGDRALILVIIILVLAGLVAAFFLVILAFGILQMIGESLAVVFFGADRNGLTVTGGLLIGIGLVSAIVAFIFSLTWLWWVFGGAVVTLLWGASGTGEDNGPDYG